LQKFAIFDKNGNTLKKKRGVMIKGVASASVVSYLQTICRKDKHAESPIVFLERVLQTFAIL
jgi:hypothetical protein